MHVYPDILVHAPVSGGTIPPTKISKNRVFSLNGACTTMRGKGVYIIYKASNFENVPNVTHKNGSSRGYNALSPYSVSQNTYPSSNSPE